MRIGILKALLAKEVRRHLANRGGIALAALLIVSAVLLSVFNPASAEAGAGGGDIVGGVHVCFVEYPAGAELIETLKARVPADLQAQVVFRKLRPEDLSGPVTYEPGTGAIRLSRWDTDGKPKWRFDVWHPPGDPGAMAPYELWFFRTVREALGEQAAVSLGTNAAPWAKPVLRDDDLWGVADSFRSLDAEYERLRTAGAPALPTVDIHRNGLGAKPLDYRSAIATAMVVFALYFTCCYLLPTLNCEERERGVLLAQALSPASSAEILGAKFLFYPMAGMGLAAILAGLYSPAVLSSLFFWLALLAMACGFLGIGMTISTLAKTQRSAFLGSMCYLFSVSLILLVCSQARIPYVSTLALEFHGPRIIHAAITQHIESVHWVHLIATFLLAGAWMTAAAWLFRKRGWQ